MQGVNSRYSQTVVCVKNKMCVSLIKFGRFSEEWQKRSSDSWLFVWRVNTIVNIEVFMYLIASNQWYIDILINILIISVKLCPVTSPTNL